MDFVLFVFAAIRGITVLLSGIVSGLNLQWMGCSMFALENSLQQRFLCVGLFDRWRLF